MAMRKMKDQKVRNLQRSHGSYYVTIPIEMIRALEWKERQKVVVKQSGNHLVIKDWKK